MHISSKCNDKGCSMKILTHFYSKGCVFNKICSKKFLANRPTHKIYCKCSEKVVLRFFRGIYYFYMEYIMFPRKNEKNETQSFLYLYSRFVGRSIGEKFFGTDFIKI